MRKFTFSIFVLSSLLLTSIGWAQTQPSVRLFDEGVEQGKVEKLDCVGAGVACTKSGVTGTMTIGGGGGGAPSDATYWVGAAHAGLSAEINLGALGTGLVINTAGTPSIYAGVTCVNQVLRVLGASGAGTCVTITSAFVDSSIVTQAYTTVEDEGAPQTQRTNLNFTGAGVSCSDSGGKTVCNIAGGGAGSANVVEVSLSLGTEMGLYYSTTVTGQAWVTSSSVIACSMFGTTADSQTPETIAVAGIIPTISDRVVGTGFNLNVMNPNGATGTVRAHCTGA